MIILSKCNSAVRAAEAIANATFSRLQRACNVSNVVATKNDKGFMISTEHVALGPTNNFGTLTHDQFQFFIKQLENTRYVVRYA